MKNKKVVSIIVGILVIIAAVALSTPKGIMQLMDLVSKLTMPFESFLDNHPVIALLILAAVIALFYLGIETVCSKLFNTEDEEKIVK